MNRRNAAGLACLAAGLLAFVAWIGLRPKGGPAADGPAAGPAPTETPAPRDLAAAPRGEAPKPRASEGPAPAEAARRLTFRVADAAGAPIAGARMWVHGDLDLERPGGPAVTDAAGLASVDGVPRGERTFHAVAPGYRVYVGQLQHGPPEDAAPVPIPLLAGVAASLRVLAADGEAGIAGARVAVEGWGIPLPVGATDATGTMALPGLPDNAETTFVVSAAGFRTSAVKLRADGGRPEREVTVVRLERGGTIRGVVRRADGAPAFGAVVRLRSVPLSRRAPASTWSTPVPDDVAAFLAAIPLADREPTELVITDDDGRFAFDGLRLGLPHAVSAQATGHAAAATVAGVVPSPDGMLGSDVEMRLRRPATLRVRWVPPADIAPPTFWSVAWTAAIPPLPPTRSDVDQDGRILLRDVVPGRVLVHATAHGFLPAAAFVDVEEGATIDLDLPLSTGATVAGTVVDVGGLPLADASVVIDRWSVDGLPGAPSIGTRTDRSGRFSVSGVWPGPIHLHVTWKDERGHAAGAFRVPATAPARDLRIVLAPEGSVRMRLLDAERRPYTRRVEVMLSTDGGGKGGTREPDDGVLSHDGLSDGDYVWVVCPSDAAWVRRTFSVRGGAAVDLDDVVLDIGATITGRALDPAGRPIADAKVRCPEVEDFRWTRTDADGRFTMEHVPRTAVRLVFETDDRYMERTVDPSDPSPVEVRLLQRSALR
ncbi:MAG: carboxypeptidase regulatory-like domain-containing protein [Planctomycetia bacterium]|nr:carboxypeptidase regulatory-like domain-containing protein [Planctomycetia bacterium]